jgi:hypothetical protein
MLRMVNMERKGKMPEGEFHPLMMPFHDYG